MLTATMILGLVVIIALLVIRFSGTPPDALPLEISLPEGVDPVSVTYAKNWYLVVGTDNQIYVYDRRSHELIQQTLITQQ